MAPFRSSKVGVMLLLASAVAGFALALHAYLAALTGVTGTPGALAVIVACVVLGVMALALGAARSRAGRTTLRVSIVVVLAATCFAALLLHRWWIALAMVVGLVGLIIDMLRAAGASRHAQSWGVESWPG